MIHLWKQLLNSGMDLAMYFTFLNSDSFGIRAWRLPGLFYVQVSAFLLSRARARARQ